MAGTTPYAAGGHTVAGGQERGFYLTDAERSVVRPNQGTKHLT